MPARAMNGPGVAGEPIRINSIGLSQTAGADSWASMSKLPCALSGTASVEVIVNGVPPPGPPQVKAACTNVTGPTVPTRFAGTGSPFASTPSAISNPQPLTRRWPLGSTFALPSSTTQGAAPEVTPRMVTLGEEPITWWLRVFGPLSSRRAAEASGTNKNKHRDNRIRFIYTLLPSNDWDSRRHP